MNEIADLVVFIEYFANGLDALSDFGIDAVTEASDVNADGIPLTVEDLVYLTRIIFGDAIPLSSLIHDTDTVTFTQSDGGIFSDMKLGAVFFEFEGNPDVTLLDTKMDMRSGFLDGRKRVLIFKIGSDELAPGKILLTDGRLLSAQASDFNGSRVVVKFDIVTDVGDEVEPVLPVEFELHQNYPNPFNPSTTIRFAMPQAGEYRLLIYNTLGRLVAGFSGRKPAGIHEIVWEVGNLPSGVYFYKFQSGDFSAGRKMLLLK
ncbi:MAG: T9SS type A sorting domain-containing protein [Candidatus Zixiibacteriota bacterium]